MLCKDLCRHFDRVILVFDQSNDHALQNHVRLSRVCVRFRQLAIGQRVVAIVKLGNIAAKILLDHKLAARMELLVATCSQYEVVTDDKRVTSCDGMLNLRWCPHFHVFFLKKHFEFFSLNQFKILAIELSQKALMDDEHQYEEYARANAKSTPYAVANLAEVSRNTATANSITKD